MAQTPAKFVHDGKAIDYTPTNAVIAGQVVELGTIPLVAPVAIPAGVLGALSCDGVFDVPKTADVFAAGDTVYWDNDGIPVTGEAGSGAADSSTGNLMGVAVADAASEASYVRVRLHAIKRMATLVAGDPITTTGITGGDASLGIAGADGATGAAGGAVAIAGGKGDTNQAGGAASLTGGAGNGTGAGGASSVVGGAGGATGAGGAIAITGGAGGSTSGNGGAITIAGGAGTAGDGNGGAVNITGGALNGGGANGAVNIAADKACAVTIGYANGTLKLVGIPTTDPKVEGQVYANGNVLTLSEGEGDG